MSPLSDRIESLAAEHDRDVLDLQEFWLERSAIREHDGGMTRDEAEQAASEDVEQWLNGLASRSKAQRATRRATLTANERKVSQLRGGRP